MRSLIRKRARITLKLILRGIGYGYLVYFIIVCGIANLTCKNQRLLLPWGKMTIEHSCEYAFH